MNETKKKQIEAAREFVALHSDEAIENWQPLNISDPDEKYLHIFNHVILSSNFERDGFGALMIEIGAHESKSGRPEIFEFPENIVEGEI